MPPHLLMPRVPSALVSLALLSGCTGSEFEACQGANCADTTTGGAAGSGGASNGGTAGTGNSGSGGSIGTTSTTGVSGSSAGGSGGTGGTTNGTGGTGGGSGAAGPPATCGGACGGSTPVCDDCLVGLRTIALTISPVPCPRRRGAAAFKPVPAAVDRALAHHLSVEALATATQTMLLAWTTTDVRRFLASAAR